MKMTKDIAYFCGLWIAEGSYDNTIERITITCGDDDVREVLESGAVFGVVFKKNRVDQWRANSYSLVEAMRFLKMPLVKAPEKYLPDWVWSGKREWACEVLAGMLDGDGYVNSGRNKVGFTSSSERLARDIQLLLTNLGVMSRLTVVESQPTERVKVCSMQYRVEILGKYVSVLKACITPRIKRKAILLATMSDDLKSKSGIPNMYAHLMSIKSVYNGTKMPKLAMAIQVARGNADITPRTLRGVLDECIFAEATTGWQAINQILNEGYFWDEVTNIEDGECETYDFTIPDTHSFWSDGFISHNTPKAYNFLYDLYVLGQKPDNVKFMKWRSWQFATITSPFIPNEEIEAARADMDDKSFSQEFLASFEVMSGRVYHSFDRKLHVGSFEFNESLPIWVGQDFNIDPMSSVIMQPQLDGSVQVIDELVLRGSNTEEVCTELEKKYWRNLKQVVLFPDPAGAYRQHARGESDLDIFRERGFKNQKFHKKHPPIADRVNAVSRMLKAADGKVRLRIDSKCVHLIKSLEQTIYKKHSREIDKDANTEHSSDAIGYCIQYMFPIRKVEIAGVSI